MAQSLAPNRPLSTKALDCSLLKSELTTSTGSSARTGKLHRVPRDVSEPACHHRRAGFPGTARIHRWDTIYEMTMNQVEKAKRFAKLHVKGSPLVLYNAWDAGSAKAIHEAGAEAVATSSWSVAAAQGYEDGEEIPLELVETIVARIAATVDVPVTADFEGGYSDNDTVLAKSISQLLHLGVIGINFEDRVVKGKGLYDIEKQAHRIAAIRKAA